MSRLIALVLPELLPLGGAERINLSIAADQLSRGHRVDLVLTGETKDVSEVVPTGARVIKLGAARLRDAVLPLARYLRTERPDAVLSSMWPVTTISVISKYLSRTSSRIVVSDHNPLSIQYANWGYLQNLALWASIRLTYGLADARVVVSEGVARDISQLSGLPASSFTVVYNPIKLPEASDHDRTIAESAWKGWTGKRILSVGRLKSQKNHQLLLRAFARLSGTDDARLMILGVGELKSETERLVRELGLEQKVLLPGHFLSPGAFYERADLFVLSSDYEGFGNVIVEALMFGLPVVSTDCPYGPREILEGGRYGVLVPVGDEVALASAMSKALKSQNNSERQKQRAIQISGSESLDQYERLMGAW